MLTPLKRLLLIVAGFVSLAIGIAGIFLPLVPTVPLVLLAAYCFARSSERLHQWLLKHPYFGPTIHNFQSGQGIPRRIKVRAIALIWLSMGVSIWVVNHLWLGLMLVCIGAAVSFYLLRLPDYSGDAPQ